MQESWQMKLSTGGESFSFMQNHLYRKSAEANIPAHTQQQFYLYVTLFHETGTEQQRVRPWVSSSSPGRGNQHTHC